MQRRGIQTMIYEGLGLPRVEFAAADVRDDDDYVRTYLPTYPSTHPPTDSPIYLLTYLLSGALYSLPRVPVRRRSLSAAPSQPPSLTLSSLSLLCT